MYLYSRANQNSILPTQKKKKQDHKVNIEGKIPSKIIFLDCQSPYIIPFPNHKFARVYNKIRELIEHKKVNRRWLVNRESRTGNLAGSADAARSAMLEASVASGAPDWPRGHIVCLWKREGVSVLAVFHAEGVSTLKTARVARLWTRPLFPPLPPPDTATRTSSPNRADGAFQPLSSRDMRIFTYF